MVPMKYLLVLVGLVSWQAVAQNLNDERIWKLVSRKKAVYLGHGVFHFNEGSPASISNLRSSYVPSLGYERVVVDFNGAKVPKLYGHIDGQEHKLSVDFFDTSVTPSIQSLKNTRHVKSVDFLAIDQNQVTMEMQLNNKSNFDVFYLENPGRLVIDIRP
jgi:hypothetical protein